MASQLDNVKAGATRIAKRTLWLSLILGILALGGYYFWRTFEKSDGTRTGVLFKVSKKGYVFKTFEGQLHMGGSAIMSEQSVWNFSAQNAQIYEELQKYEGKTVRCHYSEKVNTFPWQGDTDYLVYKVEPVQ
jgi:hypothetical protein